MGKKGNGKHNVLHPGLVSDTIMRLQRGEIDEGAATYSLTHDVKFYSIGNFAITGWEVNGSYPNLAAHIEKTGLLVYDYYKPLGVIASSVESDGDWESYLLSVYLSMSGRVTVELAFACVKDDCSHAWYLGQLNSDEYPKLSLMEEYIGTSRARRWGVVSEFLDGTAIPCSACDGSGSVYIGGNGSASNHYDKCPACGGCGFPGFNKAWTGGRNFYPNSQEVE